MPALEKTVGVAVDLAGCPNRCRHCYLGIGPNRRLSADVLRRAAEAFWQWRRPGDDEPYFTQVYAASWYREPDYSDDYRELYELERELSRTEPRRYELLSIWRLARDDGYAEWARRVGPRTCQITFFGLEEVNDWFHRRRGAFADNLKATERLLAVGMVPRWQVFLSKPGLKDLDGLMRLTDELRLPERVAEFDAEFDVFCHPPGLAGEAWNMEDLCVERADLALVPKALMDATRKHFGGELNWETEAEAMDAVRLRAAIPPYVPTETWFFVDADLDVFTNYGGEVGPAWRLGSLGADSLDTMLTAFGNDATPGLRATFHMADAELAGKYGRADDARVLSRPDIKGMWVHRCAQEVLG